MGIAWPGPDKILEMPGEGRSTARPKYSFIVLMFDQEAVVPALIERLGTLLAKLDRLR